MKDELEKYIKELEETRDNYAIHANDGLFDAEDVSISIHGFNLLVEVVSKLKTILNK